LGAESKGGGGQRWLRFIGDAAGSGGLVAGGEACGGGAGGMGPTQRSGGVAWLGVVLVGGTRAHDA
jgi:hypothetical protein